MKRSSNPFVPYLFVAALLLAAGWLLGQLSNVLTPFVAAAILAYMLNPLVSLLVRYRVSRSLAAGIATIAGVLCVFALLLIVIPMLIQQAQALLEKLPVLVDFLQGRLLPWLQNSLGTQLDLDIVNLRRTLAANAGTLRTTLTTLLTKISQSGYMLLNFLFNLMLLPLLLFYFLKDWERMLAMVARLIPRRWSDDLGELARELDQVLGEFMRGQLSVMLIMALLFGSSLALVGLDSGFVIGIVAGLLVFIPYLGTFLGFVLATVAAVLQFDNLGDLLLVLSVFTIGQLLESFLITPFLVGERIGLSPMLVIFALMAFGQLMGFVGVLLALPMAAASLVLCRFLMRPYFNSRFYQRKIPR
ncbi:AI-2E family transporter [Neisseriaceae bacterium TC5R-5]|nr:AI-2E family transporter [Neisseriaceae bacterium TC5R-5]